MITLYGLKTCGTCRKALGWLAERGVEARFHDVRAAPLPAATLAAWRAEFGDRLINRAGTTWRGLGEADRARAESDPVGLLAAFPGLMKRPLIIAGATATLGFGPAETAALAAALGVRP